MFDFEDSEQNKSLLGETIIHSYSKLCRTYKVTNQIHQAILRIRNVSELYPEICRIMVDVGGFRMAWIGIPKLDESPSMTIVGSAGITESYLEFISSSYSSNEQVPEGKGPFMQAVRTKKPQITRDIATDPLMAPWREKGLHLGFRSAAAFPVLLRGHVACVFSLYYPQPDYFMGKELRLLEEVVESLAFALEVHALEEERNQVETQRRLTAKAFESLEAMAITDQDANCVLINELFTRVTGYLQEEIIGKNMGILKSGRHNAQFYQQLWQALLADGRWEGEIWNQRKDGEIYPEWLAISAVKDQAGATTHYVAHFMDLTKWKAAEAEIKRLADLDALTGLMNRKAFYQALDADLLKRKLMQGNSYLLLIDIDRFQEVNDSLGHIIGDLLLKEVAKRLNEVVRMKEFVARLGGDEFVMMGWRTSPSKTLEQEARGLAGYLLARLSQPYFIEQQVIHMTVSIGIRTFSLELSHPEAMVHDADLAMNQAKLSGGNAIVGFDATLKQKSQLMFALEQDLRRAVERKEIEIFYQGQFDYQGRLVGVEVLSRWMRRGEWIAPSEFILLAEQTGLMDKLGGQILRGSLQQLRQWNQGTVRLPKLSINLSALQLQNPDFIDEVKQVIQEMQVNPRWMILEITESALIEDLEEVSHKLEALRAFGVQFSIDDFGTGYSSLSMLHSLPIQELKIDRQFTREMLSNPKAYAIVKSIIAIGQSLSLRVVAEGVENQNEREALFQLGCTHYQGYLFMRPESGLDFAWRLKNA